MFKNKNKGFSLVELIVVIAILVVFAAILIPSLLQYTENSRAQKDESAMDEVVNAVQLAMADQDCYDEMLQYSCTNNYITYTDSSGVYGQVIADGEFWAPDGSGRATTITFNPEIGPDGDTIYNLDKALVNDMTFGNGSVAQNRPMEGSLIENNQCYFKNASINGDATGYTYNRVRQTIGDSLITTSATYRNSSFTIFIRFSQKDNITVADVNGSFNGTNLYEGAVASKGSGTHSYDNDGNAITSIKTPGTTESKYTSTDLMGSVTLGGGTTEYGGTAQIDLSKGVYYVGVTSKTLGDYSGATATYFNGELPEAVSVGDVFVLGDYEYRYQYGYNYSSRQWTKLSDAFWGVRVLDNTKTKYDVMLYTINQKDIKILNHTFAGCVNLTATGIPVLPSKATKLFGCFTGCTSLVNLGGFKLPSSATDMQAIFKDCSSLTTAPNIPNQVMDLTSAFSGCSKLTVAPKLPDAVISLNSTFNQCSSLKEAPVIPQSCRNTGWMFNGCTSIKVAPEIPSKVTYINGMFYGCTSLQTIPQIPNGVTQMESAFYRCTALKDASGINIPSSVINAEHAFGICLELVNAPNLTTATNLKYASGMFWQCKNLQTAPYIPASVDDMSMMFQHCYLLEGEIIIDANPAKYEECFDGTYRPIRLIGHSNKLYELANTRTSDRNNVQVGK